MVRTPNGNDYGKDLLRQHYVPGTITRIPKRRTARARFDGLFLGSADLCLPYPRKRPPSTLSVFKECGCAHIIFNHPPNAINQAHEFTSPFYRQSAGARQTDSNFSL